MPIQLSGYYLADELARNYRAVATLLENEWKPIEHFTAVKFWNWVHEVV
jgi:hypothetical protein